ncbi:hypothetical protein GJU40_08035 [Bacillus lacus]|uniref:GNAT family N-acetyltransferase n=1 Tax=Metabacillus lacus TaxID=1983721 RepID=A0A7X2LZU8_9BACI|nr:GNAT family N-acetyltransferase [Metabacillus lacus]MRX72109.1 hypothetical protein [Metabacillus lacus]
METAVKDTEQEEELQQEYENLEFQLYRMQDNLKKIARNSNVIGIDQSKEDKWVIVYSHEDSHSCKIMISECDAAYDGTWDFSLQATYFDNHTIHIGDIKGPANKGYGSICMKYLKEKARQHNVSAITGDIAKRDWDHVDRLVHFYEKHDFDVSVDYEQKSGEIHWQDY